MIQNNVNVLIITDVIAVTYWTRSAGPYRLATELRLAGYTCQVVDCWVNLTEAEQLEIYDRCIGPATLMLGFSSTFLSYIDNDKEKTLYNMNRQKEAAHIGDTQNFPYGKEKMLKYFDYVRKINPNVKIVLGGYKSSYYNAPGVDVFLTGQAEVATVEYLKYLQGKNPFFQFETVNDTQMKIDGDKYNATFDFQNSYIKYEPYDNMIPGEVVTIEVGRGCIFKCKFCSYVLNGKAKNDYIKNPAVLREEFIRNYNEHGITKYIYSDDTHNDSTEKLQLIADVVQSLPFKIEYVSYLRIDLLRAHPEQYQLLKDGGIRACFFGIESLNWKSLQSIGKGLHPDKVVEELHNFADKMPHVGTEGSFMVGLPYETKDTVSRWVDRIFQPDFPIDTVYVEALGINRNPDRMYKSEFDLNSKDYFTFYKDSYVLWNNGNFDRKWAEDFCKLVYKTKAETYDRKVAGWATFFVDNFQLGKDYNRCSYSDLKINHYQERNKLRNRYIDLLFDRKK